MARVETGTADFQSTIKRMGSFTLSTGADAAVVNLRDGGAGGTIKVIVKNVVAQTTVQVPFPDGATCSDDAGWYVDLVSGTTPQMTVVGTSR